MRLRQGLLETDSTYHFMVPLLDYQAFAIFGDTASNCLSPTWSFLFAMTGQQNGHSKVQRGHLIAELPSKPLELQWLDPSLILILKLKPNYSTGVRSRHEHTFFLQSLSLFCSKANLASWQRPFETFWVKSQESKKKLNHKVWGQWSRVKSQQHKLWLLLPNSQWRTPSRPLAGLESCLLRVSCLYSTSSQGNRLFQFAQPFLKRRPLSTCGTPSWWSTQCPCWVT